VVSYYFTVYKSAKIQPLRSELRHVSQIIVNSDKLELMEAPSLLSDVLLIDLRRGDAPLDHILPKVAGLPEVSILGNSPCQSTSQDFVHLFCSDSPRISPINHVVD